MRNIIHLVSCVGQLFCYCQTILQLSNTKNYPSSILCGDSNSLQLNCQSPPVTAVLTCAPTFPKVIPFILWEIFSLVDGSSIELLKTFSNDFSFVGGGAPEELQLIIEIDPVEIFGR